ncbi:MAG TPA: SDR family oxidoreductase [Anaerolineales bacterium]|nr:SDR family oxidoreductase [Anaerolineales bacterium]
MAKDDSHKILVIGATGTVGTELIAQLTQDGHRVRALTRDPRRAARFGNRVEVVTGDLNDQASLIAAMQGVERFFLITASTQQDRNALASAREAGARHVVKISTQEAGWTPVEGHGHWHKEREELIRSAGLNWTFLRPSMYMNFALSWSAGIRLENAITAAGGNGKFGPVDPWDVASVAKAALTGRGHEDRAYELTGPELLSFGDMAAVFEKVIGRRIGHLEISEAGQGEILAKLGIPQYAVDGLVETFSLIRAGRFAYLTDDVEKTTGRKPRSFESWVRANIAAFQ